MFPSQDIFVTCVLPKVSTTKSGHSQGEKVWHYHTTQYSPLQSERIFSQRSFFLFLLLLFVFTTLSPVVAMESRSPPPHHREKLFLESKCSEDEEVLLASLMLLSLLSKTMQFKSAAKCLAVCCLPVRIYDCLLCFLHSAWVPKKNCRTCIFDKAGAGT